MGFPNRFVQRGAKTPHWRGDRSACSGRSQLYKLPSLHYICKDTENFAHRRACSQPVDTDILSVETLFPETVTNIMLPATLPSPYSSYIPFFSVVLCTYNRADTVGAALDSLLAQTEPDWECVIVDDGSTDDTAALLRSYCDRSARFRLLYHSNRGQALSRNAGILASCGLFVTFLDSDDQYAPEHLSIRKQILCENTDVEFLYGGVEITGDPYVPDLENPGRMIHIGECVVAGTIVVRRSTALQLGGFPDVAFGDDTAFYERAYRADIAIAHIDEPTYLYNRTRADSLCNLMADGGLEAIEQYRHIR